MTGLLTAAVGGVVLGIALLAAGDRARRAERDDWSMIVGGGVSLVAIGLSLVGLSLTLF